MVESIVYGTIVIGSCLIIAWSIVAGTLACLMGGLMVCTGFDQEVDDILGEGHYYRLFGIGAGIPSVTALVAIYAVDVYSVGENAAWIFWFCTWAYGFWCLFREAQVIWRVRRTHKLQQKALRGA